MIDHLLLYEEILVWKGIESKAELYEAESYEGLNPITRVRALCITEDHKIVLSQCYDMTLNLQGGKIEPGETAEQALYREIFEEAAVNIIHHKVIGFVKIYPLETPEIFSIHPLFLARVNVVDQPIEDPDHIFIDRQILDFEEAYNKLSWGERGKAILNLARKHYRFNDHLQV